MESVGVTDNDLTGGKVTSVSQRMQVILKESFSPERLEIVDDSARHAGHAGARPGGESHFRVEIVANAFSGMTRIDRHRAVNEALAELFDEGLHALQIKAKTPGEA